MGWRTSHFCDMCGAEHTVLEQQFEGDQKCDPLELCPVCLQTIQTDCQNTNGECNIPEDPIAVWDLNLYCYCPNCNNYINAFNEQLWNANGQYDILSKELLTVTCLMCQTTFNIKTVLNIMKK